MHRVGRSMEIDKFPLQPLPMASHFSSLFLYMYDAFVSLCFQFHNILNAMIYKVLKHDWVTTSLLVYMIRDVFLLGLSRGHDFRPDYEKLGTLSYVFLSVKIVTGEYHKAMGDMKNTSLVIANPDRANIFLSIHTKALICKARECQWIWRTIITCCRRAYCASHF